MWERTIAEVGGDGVAIRSVYGSEFIAWRHVARIETNGIVPGRGKRGSVSRSDRVRLSRIISRTAIVPIAARHSMSYPLCL